VPTAAATSKAGSVRVLSPALSESALASPLFECAIVGICDDDEHALFWNPQRPTAQPRRRMMGIVSGI